MGKINPVLVPAMETQRRFDLPASWDITMPGVQRANRNYYFLSLCLRAS
jgi:hypothetical protein